MEVNNISVHSNSNWTRTSAAHKSMSSEAGFGGRSLPSNQGYFLNRPLHDDKQVIDRYGVTVGQNEEASSRNNMQNSNSDPNLTSRHCMKGSVDDDMFGFPGSEDLSSSRVSDGELHLMDAASNHDQTGTQSRILLIRNVASDASDEELMNIFKSFGDVSSFLRVPNDKNSLLVTYFDLRAAISAKTTLQGTLINGVALEIRFNALRAPDTHDPISLSQNFGMIVVYNLDPDATNEHLAWTFSKFGDVKDISQSPERTSQKFVTFFDTRHAAAALQAMNRAEQLGKLPSHITPQQAASMAYITGSSPGLLQLAALQLQHEKLVAPINPPGNWSQQRGPSSDSLMGLQEVQSALEKLGLDGTDMQSALHVSDSASSIASAATAAQQLFAMNGGAQGLGKAMAAAAAAANAGHLPPGSSKRSNTGSPANVTGLGADRALHAQQLLLQSGLSTADAASMLMSLGLGHPDLPLQMMGQQQGVGHFNSGGAGGMYGAGGPSHSGSGTVLAELIEMQARQQHQQQLAAAVHAQAQAQASQMVADLQAQHALAAVGMGVGGGVGNNHHHNHHNQMTAAQLLQAAQMNLGGAGAFMPSHHQALTNAAAAQLLQQAGFGGMPGMGGAYGQAASMMLGGQAHVGGLGMGMGINGLGLASTHIPMGNGPGGGGGRGGSDAQRGGGGGRLSRRSADPAAEAERKAQQEKLYAMDADRILSGLDRRTTLMIKNIPNKYTQKMLLATIDEFFHGTYDFFYLPIDFKNKCNVGYAFINMTQPSHIVPLAEKFNQKKWERFNSEKICHISYARIQGRASLISHFQNSSLMHEDKRCRPILFVLEGHDATSEQEPFSNPAVAAGAITGPSSQGIPFPSGPPSAGLSRSTSESHQSLTACSSSASINTAVGTTK